MSRAGSLDLLLQNVVVEEVLNANTVARHLVRIGGADAAPGCSDLARTEETLGHPVECAVVGRDDMGVGADDELVGRDPARLQPVDLPEKHLEVDHHTIADHRGAGRGQDPAGQEMQGVFLTVDDDGMTGVVAAIELHHIVDVRAHEVGRLALALIAPLGADQHDRWHALRSPSVVQRELLRLSRSRGPRGPPRATPGRSTRLMAGPGRQSFAAAANV